ncbi:hypothetical protein D3C76_833090 [compost metagenome]
MIQVQFAVPIRDELGGIDRVDFSKLVISLRIKKHALGEQFKNRALESLRFGGIGFDQLHRTVIGFVFDRQSGNRFLDGNLGLRLFDHESLRFGLH